MFNLKELLQLKRNKEGLNFIGAISTFYIVQVLLMTFWRVRLKHIFFALQRSKTTDNFADSSLTVLEKLFNPFGCKGE